MVPKHKRLTLIITGVAIGLVLIGGISWALLRQTQPPRCEEGMTVALGQEFTIGANCFVKIKDTNLEVGITGFRNEPCPKDAVCVSSGLFVYLEYRVDGKVKKDIDLVRDYGLLTRILTSDYETYATLRMEESQSHYVQ